MIRSSQHCVKRIHLVLAFVALEMVRTCARGDLPNGHFVDIPSATNNIDFLAWECLAVSPGATNDNHPKDDEQSAK